MELSAPLMLVVIGLSSLLAQWLAWLLRLPAILPLLLFGILLGPAVHLVQPDLLFGDLLFPLVSLSVAIILFEGALTLRVEEIRGLGGVVRNLVSIGMLATFLTISVASWWLLDFPPELAALIGAVTVVTGPTVIAPLMRVVRPNANINQVLRWEGIVIDPVGAIFTLLVFEFIVLKQNAESYTHLFWTLGITAAVGLIAGALFGYLLGLALRRVWLPRYLQNLAVLAIMLTAFGVSNAIADESGLLTVTVMGIWLANMRDVDTSDILAFKEELSAILISALFIILAARLDINALWNMGWPLLGLLLVVQFIARPLCIAVSTWRSSLHWRDRLLLCWIAPRGIVAAAVSSLFALTLQRSGYQGADRLVTVVFAIIIGTVVLQSLTSGMMARWLRVQQQKPRGVLIVGANSVARMLAQALMKMNIPVLVTDSSWEYYRQARMEGIPAYYGHAYSEHAENYLDLSDTAQVLALSPNRHQNALAVYHFGHIFGDDHVFAIRSGAPLKGRGNSSESSRFRRHEILFNQEATYGRLSSLIAKGATIKATKLNENFGWLEYLEKHQGVIPLFCQREDGSLQPIGAGAAPAMPCTLIALVQDENPSTSAR
ncbi:potassium/proton antiporter [Serratia entomophila]|uniref:Sodium:proton antiporter n=1 Tax=Serratia entomophila TaxID=42906 RepID=A0ABY5CT20_9GAMM|nr:sodium:proton antiporter [Serratia entomophila]UIW17996.1 cation:proton antiporter [Serratia entomophila]USV00593.1 sodium:proton antiporter [Serratia entomophila]CAI0750233.1 potassium/proton antiporter [Serratia entomophila]CAI0787986.1 potassium/proton antiporter [Serratia entomophila]CAI0938567.1 potassium/proton antiporter [Serratia entomophila]